MNNPSLGIRIRTPYVRFISTVPLAFAALLVSCSGGSSDNREGDSRVASVDAAQVTAPASEGWTQTVGGAGGKILRVTTLAANGPGSFAEVANAEGPRTIVFEVGGVIDLEKQIVTLTEPFVTIAGQTAPSPGITFIRGGINIATHDVVVQHVRVRPGEAGEAKQSGWEADGISTLQGARDVIVSHSSFSWAPDENLSASGDFFVGDTPDEWRQNASRRITYSDNIIAEGLSRSTHRKPEHSKGTLVLDNGNDVLILRNLYVSNKERNPLIKGGAYAAVVNNFIVNPGTAAVHYWLTDLWNRMGKEPETGRLALVGNVMRRGPHTAKDLALFRFAGYGDLELFEADNLAYDQDGNPVPALSINEQNGGRVISRDDRFYWPEGLQALPAAEVEEYVLRHAGARPWDRDSVDERIVREVREGEAAIIDSEQQVGGYPEVTETRQRFDPSEWNLSTMTGRGAEGS